MYQYSLSYFTKLFNTCIDTAAKSDDLPTRLNNLMLFTTEFMYKMVRRHAVQGLALVLPLSVRARLTATNCMCSQQSVNKNSKKLCQPRATTSYMCS